MREVKVGPTEFRLLHFLMTHPERVHSQAQLVDRVWGDHVFIEERRVNVHVKRLREALARAHGAGFIETVRGFGSVAGSGPDGRSMGGAAAPAGFRQPTRLRCGPCPYFFRMSVFRPASAAARTSVEGDRNITGVVFENTSMQGGRPCRT